jgi:hypothetical protein
VGGIDAYFYFSQFKRGGAVEEVADAFMTFVFEI